MIKQEFILSGLDCANCAAKIEAKLAKLNSISNVSINFLTSKLNYEVEEDKAKEAKKEVEEVILKTGENVSLKKAKAGLTNKRRLTKILIGGGVFALGMILTSFVHPYVSLGVFLVAYIIIGGDVVLKAVKNIAKGHIFDENFLMFIATVGAFLIGEHPEAVAVMLFYQVGELFQDYAVNKSRKSIAELMDIRPDYANVKRGEEVVRLSPLDVKIGDIMVIKPGEKVALDGVVTQGTTVLDTSALTGETLPRDVSEGNDILSGCVNLTGLIQARVTKEYGQSTVAKILDLVENASAKKSNSENFITKFAKYYTPAVVGVAVVIAIVPPLILGWNEFNDWLYRALTFLMISCPCALVISIPLSFFGGIGGASKQGILIKGGNYLEALAKTEIAVFDKTGTLTKGVFNVREVHPQNITQEELLEVGALAESFSNHPISASLKKAYGKKIDNARITNAEELAGFGVKAVVDGKKVYAGNAKLMAKMGFDYNKEELAGTVVHVGIEDSYAGYILIADEVKEDAQTAVTSLKEQGVAKTVMLTGDNKAVGESTAKALGLDTVYAELLPVDKVEKVETLLKEKSGKGKLIFVGDGINDAPVIARADIGIAMGGLGSDAAIEAADVVIMTDEPSKIAQAIKVSKKTLSIVKQNICFALGVKGIILILGAFGFATMWEAVIADVGVSVIAILNAMRAMRAEK